MVPLTEKWFIWRFPVLKVATIKSTDYKFDYIRANFTTTIQGRYISVNQSNTNIIPANHDLTALKNALVDNKCAVVCLKTGFGPGDTHFVLADGLLAGTDTNYLDRIQVVDAAQGGVRRTLRSAIERKLTPAKNDYVLSAYIIS